MFGKKTTSLHFFMKSGNSFVVDKVTEWTIGYGDNGNPNEVTKLVIGQSPKCLNKLIVASLDLRQIEAIVEHR